jgi:hypothetical protein
MTLKVAPYSAPCAIGLNLETTYSTNLDNSYLYIGKNPMYSTSLPPFMFGGMAIFDRVLTDAEVATYWTYFIKDRTA